MGRYYEGDIEGKFWFAIQDSNAADRFGCIGEPRYLSYYFCEDDLDNVKKEIEVIKSNLGEYKAKIDEFFDKKSSYNFKELAEYIGVKEEEIRKILSEYADLQLGEKIQKCIEENGECSFEAEL